MPPVSIVIITKDRRDDLDKCIDSFSDLDYPKEKLEIVVVEEGDKPDSINGLRYIFIPRQNRGWGYARNVGIANASHGIIGFVDDDCLVTRHWLKNLIVHLEDGIGGVTGGVRVKDCNVIGYCENVLGFPNGGLLRIHTANSSIQQTKNLSTCNCLYRREVFEKLGGFYEAQNTRGTDMEFAMRATKLYKCLYVPNAVVYHRPRGSLSKIFHWFVDRGKSQIALITILERGRHHIGLLVKNSLILRSLFLGGTLYILGALQWYILAGIILAYYTVIMKRYAFQFKYFKRVDTVALTPLVKITMDIGMEVGEIAELWKTIRKR